MFVNNIGILSNYPLPKFHTQNLALWLDATDTSTVILSSGTVQDLGQEPFSNFPILSAWLDKSGNNRHFYSLSARNAPLYLPASATNLNANALHLYSESFYEDLNAKFLINYDYTWGVALSSQITIFSVITVLDDVIVNIISQSSNALKRRSLQFSLYQDQGFGAPSVIEYYNGPDDGSFVYETEPQTLLNGNFFGINVDSETNASFFMNRSLTAVNNGNLTFGNNYLTNSPITIGISPFTALGPIGVYNAEATSNTQLHEILIYDTNLPKNISEGIIKYLQIKYQNLKPINYLLVAGGGSGASFAGGGGGAGGLLTGFLNLKPGSYPITIGQGGAAVPGNQGNNGFLGYHGENSTFFTLTAIGGGAGSGDYSYSHSGNYSIDGGSGGSGGARENYTFLAGMGIPGQGHDGSTWPGGGGGAGGPAITTHGGLGYSTTITGTLSVFATGGSYVTGLSGIPNTGNGGDGIYSGQATDYSGSGGSGIAIIAYECGNPLATGGDIASYTKDGKTYWVHTFKQNGTFSYLV